MGSSSLLLNTFFMDHFDVQRPRFSPIVDSTPYRFSVGVYRGRKRVVIAWFVAESTALDYLARCRRDNPSFKYDYLKSLF